MRLVRVKLAEFKGVEAEIEFAPAMVLFGPNDAGKTNLLEALEVALGGGSTGMLRRDPAQSMRQHGRDPEIECSVVLKLDGLGTEGHPDQQLIMAGVSEEHGVVLPAGEELVAPAGERPEDQEFRWVWTDDDPPVSVQGAVDLVGNVLARRVSATCNDWRAVEREFLVVLNACLESTTFRLDHYGCLWWLAPDHTKWKGATRRACESLAGKRFLWPDDRVPVFDPLLDPQADLDSYPFVGFWSDYDPSWVEFGHFVFVAATDGDNWLDLLDEIESTVDKRARPWEEKRLLSSKFPDGRPPSRPRLTTITGRGRPTAGDFWFVAEGDVERIHPDVLDECRKLGSEATRIAPPFLSRIYEIVVRPVPARERPAFGDRRVQLALRHHEQEQIIDLGLVGSGLRTWARYSLHEAIRLANRVEPTAIGDSTIKPTRVYVFDEPERHLHPAAQDEVAQWIADRVNDGVTALIATHAPSFLELPYEGTEYFLIVRDQDGKRHSHALRLTPDVVGLLDEQSEAVGLARSDILLLTRAFLIVEGETDRRIVTHFYGSQLTRERVFVIPVHGTSRAKALPESELLRRLGKPVMLLFDNTADPASDERRVMEDIIDRWPVDAPAPTRVLLSVPDILRVLPDELFARTLDGWRIEWPGWEELERRFEASKEQSLKKYMLKALQIQGREEELVSALLVEAPGIPLDGSPLHPAMEAVLAQARPVMPPLGP